MRLSQLGWTQEAIGEVIGRERSMVSKIVNNIDTDKIHNLFSEGETPTVIVNKFGPEEIYNFYNEEKSPEDIAKMFYR